MNFLIIGGLLLLAVVAIVGAILLVIGEQRSEKARTTVIPGTPAINAIPRTGTSPLIEERRAQPARPAEDSSTPARQATPTQTLRETPLYPRSEDQQLFSLNGQFHELAAELRSLYQQAADLERRLRGLTEIADRLENSQSGRVGVEE